MLEDFAVYITGEGDNMVMAQQVILFVLILHYTPNSNVLKTSLYRTQGICYQSSKDFSAKQV